MATKVEHVVGGGKGKDGATPSNLTPNDELAQKVVAALLKDGLVSEADAKKIQGRLAAGTLDEAGWKLVFENQLDSKKVKNGDH